MILSLKENIPTSTPKKKRLAGQTGLTASHLFVLGIVHLRAPGHFVLENFQSTTHFIEGAGYLDLAMLSALVKLGTIELRESCYAINVHSFCSFCPLGVASAASMCKDPFGGFICGCQAVMANDVAGLAAESGIQWWLKASWYVAVGQHRFWDPILG